VILIIVICPVLLYRSETPEPGCKCNEVGLKIRECPVVNHEELIRRRLVQILFLQVRILFFAPGLILTNYCPEAVRAI
jgi:hypothetical protein